MVYNLGNLIWSKFWATRILKVKMQINLRRITKKWFEFLNLCIRRRCHLAWRRVFRLSMIRMRILRCAHNVGRANTTVTTATRTCRKIKKREILSFNKTTNVGTRNMHMNVRKDDDGFNILIHDPMCMKSTRSFGPMGWQRFWHEFARIIFILMKLILKPIL